MEESWNWGMAKDGIAMEAQFLSCFAVSKAIRAYMCHDQVTWYTCYGHPSYTMGIRTEWVYNRYKNLHENGSHDHPPFSG